jgi:Holliday junction resolvase RusA-like endonuclease
MPLEIKFFVPGVPKTAGSKRAFIPKGWTRAIITEDCKGSKDWRGDVKRFASENYHGPLLEGPLEVEFVFQLTRPNGHFRTGKNAGIEKDSAPPYPHRKPDVLKLARAAEDALSSVLYRDDAQIVVETLRKVYGVPGLWVTVKTL